MWQHKQYQLILGGVAIVLCMSPVSAETERPYDLEPSTIYSDAQLEVIAKKVGISDEIKIVKNGNASSALAMLHAENVLTSSPP
jgi:hypothetical protein